MEVTNERFAKLLLGDDMSGSGQGVPALAIRNAVTNLSATVFGQLWMLAPLSEEKKLMWRKELDSLLYVCEHMVEQVPYVQTNQTLPDGTKLEIMTSRPRTDILIYLPALRKLDLMLLEILDSFADQTEFWYEDQALKTIQSQEEKCSLPVPRLHARGLLKDTRMMLRHQKDCAVQILKAATVINSSVLDEMEVPNSYIESLPKNGKSCLGEFLYRNITSDYINDDHHLLATLNVTSEQAVVDLKNRVEASVHVWRSKIRPRSAAKSSWEVVRDFVMRGDRARALLSEKAERAETFLLYLKQIFTGVTETSSDLDVSKIECNKDVGKSILEIYSRVLQSLACNISTRIDDVLYIDLFARDSHIVKMKYGDPDLVTFTSLMPNSSLCKDLHPRHIPVPRPLIANGNKLWGRGTGVKRVFEKLSYGKQRRSSQRA